MKKKKVIAAGIFLVIAGTAVGTGIYFFSPKEENNEMPQMPEGMSLSEDVVSATGLTSTGMLEEIYELGFLENGLYVEETYLNMGDEVEENTPVFKVSEESLSEARVELEKKVKETQLNRREGEITYETGLIDAQKEKDLADVEAAYAQAVYDDAVATAQESVDKLQEQVDEAQEKVDEYTASIEQDYYYTYYEVGELKEIWQDYASFLMELYNTWNVPGLEDIFGGSGGKNGIGYVTNQVGKSASMSDQTGSSQAASDAEQEISSDMSGDMQMPSGVNFSQESVIGASDTTPLTNAQASTDNGDGSNSEDSTGNGNGTNSEGENSNGEGTNSEGENSNGEGTNTGAGTANGDGTNTEDPDPNGDEANSGDENSNGDGNPSDIEGGAESDNSGNNDGQENEGDHSGDMPSGGYFNMPGGELKLGATPKTAGRTVGDDEIRYNIYLAMVEETDEIKALYDEAVENYENAKATAEAGIEKAKSELVVLQAKLDEEKISYEQSLIEAQKAYDQAIAGQKNAQMVYDSTVKQLEEDFDTLKDEEESALENQELFEETVGDGYFYTKENGTVMMTTVRSGSTLTEDSMILAYSNPDVVTVAASVDQSDIAKISVGQQAYVVISSYGSFEGIVSSFNPVSSSAGSANVTYMVNVKLEGDISALESNLTAYVYFGLTDEEKQIFSGNGKNRGQSENGAGKEFEGREFNGEELPEGMMETLPEGMEREMPEAMPGEMPEGMENRTAGEQSDDMIQNMSGGMPGNMPEGGQERGVGGRP